MLVLLKNTYRVVQWFLFLALLTYVLLRAVFTETLHDETATYYFYFYQGDYIGEFTHWDANNHLLNSFLGHQLYKLFGDQMSILRLPNVLAFVLYFWGTVRLTRNFQTAPIRSTSLLALNTIPFIIEYFSAARGYGLSLGFLIWGLVYFQRHYNNYNLKQLAFSYAFLWLGVASNLTLLNTAFIVGAIAFFIPLVYNAALSWKNRLTDWLVHLLFLLSLLPLIFFAFELKDHGALYYGSLDGLWEITGKSLSRYILFHDADWLKFAFISALIGVVFGIVQIYRRTSFKMAIVNPIILYAFLFFGNLLMIIALALFLEVNYPEDRTGIYLVPLFLLLLFHLFDAFSFGKYFHWTFLFFPVTFLLNLSLDSSVFTPDDRLNNEFYSTVKKHIGPQHSVMIVPTMFWNWNYAESHQKTKSSVAQTDNPNTILADFIVTKTNVIKNQEIFKKYDKVAYHPGSTYTAFKRKTPLSRIFRYKGDEINYEGIDPFIGIATFNCDSLAGKPLQIDVIGQLITFTKKNKLSLVVEVMNNDGSNSRYFSYSFEASYQGKEINDQFEHHFVLEPIGNQEKEIKVYIWNRAFERVKLTHTSGVLNELTGL